MAAKILNVDDNEASRYVRTCILREAGYEVVEAATGAEALDRFVAEEPQLVLLDVRLPDMSGFDVCRRVKGSRYGIASVVVHISASVMASKDRVRGLEGGADAYLVEPVEPELLVATIQSLLRQREAEEALRSSEERRRLAQAAAGIGTWDWDVRTDRMTSSDEYYAMFGLDPALPLLEYPVWLERVHPDDRARVRAEVQDSLQSGAPYLTEYRITLADGSVRWINSRGTVFRNELGEAVRMLGASLDVTEQKQGRAALERANDDLKQFAYAASHDLQEPLRTISSYAQLLTKRSSESLDENAREFLAFILDGTRRMRELLDGLLAYAAVQTQEELPLKPVEMAGPLHFALANLRTAVLESGAMVTFDGLPTVMADAGQLSQVFQNLVGNAIKYRRAGETPRVQVTAERRGDRWVVSVADNGQGFEAHHSERIFVVFKRLHGREVPGTGVGLALCKRIVERHGGEIWAESEPGVGSTFRFTLAAVQGRVEAAAG